MWLAQDSVLTAGESPPRAVIGEGAAKRPAAGYLSAVRLTASPRTWNGGGAALGSVRPVLGHCLEASL